MCHNGLDLENNSGAQQMEAARASLISMAVRSVCAAACARTDASCAAPAALSSPLPLRSSTLTPLAASATKGQSQTAGLQYESKATDGPLNLNPFNREPPSRNH
jgi:hypothetical protein